jgi:polar amino acid transport system permease protein
VIWDTEFALEVLPEILRAVRITILATVLGMALALVLGLVLAIARRSPNRWVTRPVGWFIEFVRSTPLLVQLFFVFFVLPILDPRLAFSAFTTGVIVLGIHYATYTSEVYRAGIDSVPRGQWEAARAVNFSTADTWGRIVLPQAIPPIVPAMGNYLISMFKDTPQLLAIGVAEVLGTAREVGTVRFRFLEPLTIAALVFLVLSYASSLLVRQAERRWGTAVAERR